MAYSILNVKTNTQAYNLAFFFISKECLAFICSGVMATLNWVKREHEEQRKNPSVSIT